GNTHLAPGSATTGHSATALARTDRCLPAHNGPDKRERWRMKMPRPNHRAKWPSASILSRAVLVADAGPIRFVDTAAASRYLALDPHTLECYRSLDTGPAFYKFGRYI